MARNSQRATEARDAMALSLAARGLNTYEIAAELGYETHSGAVKAVRRALDRQQPADAEDYRKMHVERNQAYRKKLLPLLESEKDTGKYARIVEVLVKVDEREAKLLGLDIAEPAVTLTQENLTIVVAANVNVDAI